MNAIISLESFRWYTDMQSSYLTASYSEILGLKSLKVEKRPSCRVCQIPEIRPATCRLLVVHHIELCRFVLG